MKDHKKYNLFLFLSTFSRNIIDIYSIIYLYQKFLNIKDILIIYIIVYFLGIFISSFSLKLGNRYGYKYPLIFSQITTAWTFYLIQKSTSIPLIAIFLSLSTFTYHPIRHYYGLKLLKNKSSIGLSLIANYLGILLSSFFVIKNIKMIYLLIISIIGIIPIIFIKKESYYKIKYPKKITSQKFSFFIFDQFKIIFLLLEPLYLYTISKTISFVGIFNIVITISSIIYIYLVSNKINIEKHYCYLNILFVIVLILKLNLTNKYLLLIIAFLEGIGIKTNELISTMNLYNYDQKNEFSGYLIISEIIFCLTRTILLGAIYVFNLSLITTMYLLLGGIFILSFLYQKRDPKSLT